MPELKLDAGTSLFQLQAFQQSVGNKDEIRAKRNDDGTTTLYTHSNWKISLNRDPALRHEKQQAAYTAVAGFLKDKFGDAANVGTLFGRSDQPLRSDALNKAIQVSHLRNVVDYNGLSQNQTLARMEEGLAIPEVRTAFKEFCRKEFSSENINLQEAEHFEALLNAPTVDMGRLKSELSRIVGQYVIPDAVERTNVPDKLREDGVQRNEAVQPNPQLSPGDLLKGLADARHENEQVLTAGTWMRFTRSNELSEVLPVKLQNEFAAERARVIEANLRNAGVM